MAKVLRVVLVRPSVDVLHKFSKPVEALGIAYLAAALRLDGHEVTILDAMLYDWSEDETLERIERLSPDLIGFTIVLNHFPDRLVRLLTKMNEGEVGGVVIVGGHAVSFFPERVLNNVERVDAVLSGEGEAAIRQIARLLVEGGDWRLVPGLTTRGEHGHVKRLHPERIHDLTTLPWAARDTTAEIIRLDGVPCISTSRGCYARCSFCSVPRFYGLNQGRSYAPGTWLRRQPADVVNEIEWLHSHFALRELLIVDDEFFGGTDEGFERARVFARMLAERNLGLSFAISCRAENVRTEIMQDLKRAGLSHVFVGIEAGSQRDLRLYGKAHTVDQNRRAAMTVKSLGLTFQAGFMLFNPRSTLQDLSENVKFLKEIGELKPVTVNSAVDPHFGAPLIESFRRNGILRDDELRLSLEYVNDGIKTAKLVAEMCAEAYQPFMNFIGAVQSSVTFEWRRPNPTRRPAEQHLLDTFEKKVNGLFTGVFEDALVGLHEKTGLQEVVQVAERQLKRVVDDARLLEGLVVTHLEAVEGDIRYWSSRCTVNRGGQSAEFT
ncbi:radical SAM protein [Caballeronia sp. AZ1_KS37]|uniref:B12-binding domain-containing radical SAM protein n=1 Tax=Caballeronia sp. AZ1_KS37 TaxID=2921756 RepID=UPI002027AFC9|nr:radical SAM protein [Caballeronia sp. AZ1_KS37]